MRRKPKKYRLPPDEKCEYFVAMAISALHILASIGLVVVGMLDFGLWSGNIALDIFLWSVGIVSLAIGIVMLEHSVKEYSNRGIEYEYEVKREEMEEDNNGKHED